MVKKRELNNPPINEALLDIRVTLPEKIQLSDLRKFQEKIKSDYPHRQTKIKWEGKFEVTNKNLPKSQTSKEEYGYLFLSPNKDKIVQVRLDGFTFNKLKPYEGWEKFKKEAIKHWEQFLKLIKPINVNRIALRYINEINLPLPFRSLEEYVLTTPKVGAGIPQQLSNYFFRLEIPDIKTKNVANIIQTIKLLDEQQKILPLIFDIDVYRKVILNPKDKELFNILSSLREYKNTIFFNSITSKTLKIFD